MNEQNSNSTDGFRICGPLQREQAVVFDPIARHFLLGLVRAFQSRIDAIRDNRRGRAIACDPGEPLNFLEDTEVIRKSDWRVAEPPADLTRRIVEITGPVERKSIFDAINSGADVFMADFEDSSGATWQDTLDGQLNLQDVVRRRIEFTESTEPRATLMVRPRGLHLDESHVEIDGEAVPAALLDFGLYLFHNARELVYRGTGPYFYLPALEHYSEARFWNDVFIYSQHQLGLKRGTIRATALVGTLSAAFQMDEILFELREHSAGLNSGRLDHIFSQLDLRRTDSSAVSPDRDQQTMDQPCIRAYSQLLVQTCHRRGIHAIGGMAAQIPVQNDVHRNKVALDQVQADMTREVLDGHDGTWVAHPGLVPLAREIFESYIASNHQIGVKLDDLVIESADLLAIPEEPRTEGGLREGVRVAIQYLEAWIGGDGHVPIDHPMEDKATAETSRAQVWQWLHDNARLADGRVVTPRLINQALSEELHFLRQQLRYDQFDDGQLSLERAGEAGGWNRPGSPFRRRGGPLSRSLPGRGTE